MPRYSERTGLLQEYQPGPFDGEHIYVQWGGKLPGGEQWSCGFRMRKKSAGTVDNGTALLAGVAGALVTFHTAGGSHIHTAAKLSFVKVNAIAVSGRYRDELGPNQALYPDLDGAASGPYQPPNQVALVVTLTTPYTRGPAHKGRIYLPMPNVAVAADGRIPAIEADAVSDTFDTLLSNLNAVNSDYEVALFSRKAGAAGHRAVTGNRVGRVLDTQRRRRRSLAEDYQ